MPALANPRLEHFSSLVVGGATPTKAYVMAGYSEKGAAQSAYKLLKKAEVSSRIAELQQAVEQKTIEGSAVTRGWIIDKLKFAAEVCLKIDNNGKPAKTWNPNSANQSLRLLGLELGMFHEGIDHNVKFTEPAKMTESELDLWITLWEQRQLASDQAQQPALPAPLTIETTAVDDGEAKS